MCARRATRDFTFLPLTALAGQVEKMRRENIPTRIVSVNMMRTVVQELPSRIDFDEENAFARRWWVR